MPGGPALPPLAPESPTPTPTPPPPTWATPYARAIQQYFPDFPEWGVSAALSIIVGAVFIAVLCYVLLRRNTRPATEKAHKASEKLAQVSKFMKLLEKTVQEQDQLLSTRINQVVNSVEVAQSLVPLLSEHDALITATTTAKRAWVKSVKERRG